MKHRNLGHNQYLKKKFRQTAKWKQMRIDAKDKAGGIDFITQKRLLKGFNVHHLDMSLEHYEDDDLSRYIALNKASHELIHFLWVYYQKDPHIIDRIVEVLERMRALI